MLFLLIRNLSISEEFKLSGSDFNFPNVDGYSISIGALYFKKESPLSEGTTTKDLGTTFREKIPNNTNYIVREINCDRTSLRPL